jgi:hypothetical protein
MNVYSPQSYRNIAGVFTSEELSTKDPDPVYLTKASYCKIDQAIFELL